MARWAVQRQRQDEPPVGSLADQIARMAPSDGIASTSIPDLVVYRYSQPATGLHALYRPSLCVVAQGAKRARFGRRSIDYDAQRFFFAAVPMAADIDVLRATAHEPLLGLVLQMSHEMIARVALAVDEAAGRPSGLRLLRGRADRPEIQRSGDIPGFVAALGSELRVALERLLRCGADTVRGRVLYPHVLQEIVFLLLEGAPGSSFRAALGRGLSVRNVVGSARYIDDHFTEKLSVPRLARRAGMSVSAYYDGFRRVTSLSPMRYVKRIRLQQSRVLLTGGASVTEAAFAVGYASTSQFSRDFRSFFTLPPSRMRPGAA